MLLTMLNLLVCALLWMNNRAHCATAFTLTITFIVFVVTKEVEAIACMNAILSIIAIGVSDQVHKRDEMDKFLKECETNNQ